MIKLRQMYEEKHKEEKALVEKSGDAFLNFGFGIMSYRNTIFNLALLFLLFSIISYPLGLHYKNGGGITSDVKTKFGRKSIANLGYSSLQCINTPYGMRKAALSCPYGQMTQIVANGVGITPSKTSKQRDACIVDELFAQNKACSD